MIVAAKISSKGQLTLPKKVRKYLQVQTGDTLIFEVHDKHLLVRKSSTVEQMFDSLPPLENKYKNELPLDIALEAKKSK